MERKERERILSYPKLVERLNSLEDREKVLSYLEEMASDYKEEAIQKIGRLIEWTVMKLYDSWNVEVSPDVKLSELAEKAHLIFVPNHQSHADYLILNYIMHRRFNLAPFIAGGINLNVFPIGKLFRESGCFFIRRSFQNNILYKLTLEAYLAYLLEENIPIEFFYEGGRSRTGKLLPPKYGFFQLILEAHKAQGLAKPLVFIPVSIAHEVVPEYRSLIKEMEGGRKKEESFGQLLKLYKFMTRKFGSVYLHIGTPIFHHVLEGDVRDTTQRLAFRCYHAVGRGLRIHPYALLSLILLDHPSGVLTWKEIAERGRLILDYCKNFHLPCAKELLSEDWEDDLRSSMQLMLSEKKVELTQNVKLNKLFYHVNPERRIDLLHAKNALLHHFIVPFVINFLWINLFNGRVKDQKEVKALLLDQRDQLKYEFYLPTTKDLFLQGMEILTKATGREIKSMDDGVTLTPKEIYAVGELVSPFMNSFRSIYEGYYITCEALRYLRHEVFSHDKFMKTAQEIFEMEIVHGRLVRHRESFHIPALKNGLSFMENKGMLGRSKEGLKVLSPDLLEQYRVRYIQYLSEVLVFDIRIKKKDSV